MRHEPFSGVERGGWTVEHHPVYESWPEFWVAIRGEEPHATHITSTGELWGRSLIGSFPTPELARQVAEAIESAKAGKRVGPIDELLELLSKFVADSGGDMPDKPDDESIGWMDCEPMQITFGDIRRAKAILAKYHTPGKTGERES